VFSYEFAGIGRPPSLVQVPTHFFKVVVVAVKAVPPDDDDGDDDQREVITRFACFVVPNDEAASDHRPLQDYAVRWTDLECVTGLTFYPALLAKNHDEWRLQADQLTDELRTENDDRAPHLLLPGGVGDDDDRSALVKKNKNKKKMQQEMQLQHLCVVHPCGPREHNKDGNSPSS
jgi:hypothetical protein